MKFFLTFNVLLFIPFCFADFVFGQNVSELIPAKTRELTIPFEVRPDHSADPIKEVELLYSQNRGVHWHTSARKPLDAGKFGFKTETDGEYWFAFRTITLSGVIKQSSTNTPIRVLIDATPPKLAFEIKQLDSGELFVVWKAEDQYFQMKRPDFAVHNPVNSDNSDNSDNSANSDNPVNSDNSANSDNSIGSNSSSEKNWTPLNIDARNIRVIDSGLEGSFRFLPENGAAQLELRVSIQDFVGNRVEKTSLVTIKPVQHEKIPQSNIPVMRVMPENTATLKTNSLSLMPEPLTPPKPVRIQQQTKIKSNKTNTTNNNNNNSSKNLSLQKSEEVKTEMGENILETEENDAHKKDMENDDKNKTDLPIPILVSPDGKVAEIAEQIKEPQTVLSNKSDKMAEELLANMGAFFDGGLPVEITKTVPKTSATRNSTATQSDVPQSVVGQPVMVSPTESKLPAAGGITGISLNNTSSQPQIIVKWNIGDVPWQESQIDILRASSKQGPWQPIAINLRNNGEYWWFLTSLDLNPFFIMVRIRNIHNGTTADITQSPIKIDPTFLKQGFL
ncbi:MAG: hypothetical protein LBC20_15040 [Planctomycetaceae bacterium]|jgi:hypothetical protein|nr:hypothetical protein [Planctomycetaceae bacterium]